MSDNLKKWRLILGKQADPQKEMNLDGALQNMDNILEALYGEDAERQGGLGSSAPNVNRWLGDIRKYFPSSVVQVMQQDAMDRLGLEQMLMEPEMLEALEPDINLVGTLLSLNKIMPSKTKETARKVVQKVVSELEKKINNPLREAIDGGMSRAVRNNRPTHQEIDWNRTIRLNLKHYQKEYKTIIPANIVGYGKKGKALKNIILLVDQSGSMASSVVYASVFGAVMASLRSVKTHMVVFDTSVVDLTSELRDPVELLFCTQLGGGTDINGALAYTQSLIQNPSETILILISDLYEGGNQAKMLQRCQAIKHSGVQFITLLALSDQGASMFDKNNAGKLAALGIPSFACTPDLFPDLMAAAIKKENINHWMSRNELVGH